MFIRDALRFISAFIVPISQSAPHIYISALSFAPEQSLVANKFHSRLPNTIVVTEGKPSHWPMVVFTAEHHEDPVYSVFSPDESTFASISASGDGDRIMCVCDSETGHCISGPFGLAHDGFLFDACFSPDGRRILLEFYSYAVVLDIATGEEQFQIKGWDFVFVRHNGRIASTHCIGKDEGIYALDDSEDEGGDQTGIVVKLWDASNGTLICNRLFKVNDVARTQFSPDGHFLAIERRSDSVIELWNLKDDKDCRQFSYPPGNLLSFVFSPTSDFLMGVSHSRAIYLWKLDTQEMASFNHDFDYVPDVIHSPFTNYLFIRRDHTVRIWDVLVTGLELIWETNPPTTICSSRPSRDGHRLLVGCEDGSVRMWELDLENLAMNWVDIIDTQADTVMPEFIAFSHSGKMVAVKSRRSHNIEFLDTTTGEVVACMDIDDGMEIAFSPDEDQVAFWSGPLITVCDIKHPNNRLLFYPIPIQDIWMRKVVFQTCNDLVICTVSWDGSGLLQVWHRQDPAGFKCTHSLDIKSKQWSFPCLAPDGLAIVIMPYSSSTQCHSWNHNTAQFHLVNFDDQVHICYYPLPVYSPDGRLFAHWSSEDYHIRVWDTRTGQLISKFPTSRVGAMALSPTLIKHSPGDRLIALWFEFENTIHLLDVYTGHLYAKILGRGSADMAFIRDGTKLAHYSPDFGLRILDVTDEHWHSAHGYELTLQGTTDGWVMGRDNERLFWVPVEHRVNLCVPSHRMVIGVPQKKTTSVDLSNSRFGRKWTECIDKEWLRELKQKEKEVGNLLER